MSGSPEPSTLSLLILLAKRFKEVGTKYKKELAVSQLFAWIAQLPPAIIPAEWYSSLRSVVERKLYPLKLPIAHVDNMKPPFTEVSTRTLLAYSARQTGMLVWAECRCALSSPVAPQAVGPLPPGCLCIHIFPSSLHRRNTR